MKGMTMEYISQIIAVLSDGFQWHDLIPLTLIFSSAAYKYGFIKGEKKAEHPKTPSSPHSVE